MLECKVSAGFGSLNDGKLYTKEGSYCRETAGLVVMMEDGETGGGDHPSTHPPIDGWARQENERERERERGRNLVAWKQ